MLKKLIIMVMLLGIIAAAATACVGGEKIQLGQIPYDIVDLDSQEFKEINQGKFTDWYEGNFKIEGISSYTIEKSRYVMVSAGEKPTGGYYIEDLSLKGEEKTISATATLRVPTQGEIVTQAITYPHIIVKIANDKRELILEDIKDTTEKIKTDSGTYVGQIDNNSIEIKISGVPEDLAYRAFRLGDEVREKFAEYDLKEGDQVVFSYVVTEYSQLMIIEIEKIKN